MFDEDTVVDAVSDETLDSAPEETVEVDEEATDTEEEVDAEEGEDTDTTDEDAESDGDGTDDTDGKDGHKKDANSRIRELIERSKKAEEELNDLKTKFEAEQKQREAEQKPYYELDMNKVEADIAEMYEEVDTLKLEGRFVEAANKQRQIVKILDAVDANEKAKEKWEAEQAAKKAETTQAESRIKEIEDAAAFYQKHLKIPNDVWEASGNWFRKQLDSDPLLGRKFVDMIDRQGAVASIEWAHKYAVENMSKEAKVVKEKKEEAKKHNIGGTSSAATTVKSPKSFDELMKLSGKEIQDLEKHNPKLFNKLINQKLNRR